jgi:hypothetical protein
MMPRLSRRCSKALRPPLPPDSRVVNTIPLSVRVEAGMPCVSSALVNVVTTTLPVTRRWAVTEMAQRELVVDPAQDLDVAAVGEPPVGEVTLPALVGQVGLEADVGRARSFLRFDLGEAGSTQGAIDRCRRHAQVVMLAEMPGDRVRPGVQPSSDQFVTQLHDQLGGLAQDGSRMLVCGRRERGSNAASPSAR